MITLHLVKEGDTLSSLAKQYNVPLERLMLENDVDYYRDLNVGQIISISHPEKTYYVNRGDTIESILETNNITLMELLRNNPQINQRNGLRVGEYLVLSYGEREQKIAINGMCFYFIDRELLRKTLPYLTYITIMGYMVGIHGEISDIEDEDIIEMSKEYGVVPLMLVSSQDNTGVGTYDITNVIFRDLYVQERLVDNIIDILGRKGYSGAVFGFQYILDKDVDVYKNFIDYATRRLHEAGYLSWEVIIPKFLYEESEMNRLEVTKDIDGVILLAYQWANNYIPNLEQTTYAYKRRSLELLLNQVDPQKISIGISRISYDWELPYVEGQSFVISLTDPGALALANQYSAVIEYDEEAKFPYFYYVSNGVEHAVWFKDERYTIAVLGLVKEFGLGGITIWNIMYFSKIYFTLDIEADIEKLLPVDENKIIDYINS